ncbi:DUF5689 domain-containing protein [Empedobacter brevis]|uniref:DUF5689 domain-containing protein n=1 Tax=Empedobacter brevis TaxID=247 RepID=UPI0039B067D6
MNTITKLTIATALSLGLFTVQSCVQDDDYSIPSLECPQKKETNITIKELLDQVSNKTLKVDENGMVADNLIVEGVVITSDESGNLANTISFQDKASGATAGIQIELGERPVYGLYPIGSTVQVNLKGLKVAEDRGTIRIGTKLADSTFDLDRMPKELRERVFVKTCDPIQAIAPKVVNSLEEAFTPENINTLVTIKNVQFKSPDKDETYYPKGATANAVNVKLMDVNGNETDLRNSKFANFAETKLPTGSGSITVLVSKFTGGYQVFIRDTKDVNFDQPRFVVIPAGTVEINGTKEDFELAKKNNYRVEDLALTTGTWIFSDGGVFDPSASDLKLSGTSSVRLRGSSTTEAFIQSKFFVTGLKTLKVYFGGATFNEGADADKEIKLEVLISTDFGATWKSVGEKTSERGKLNLLEFPINAAATERVSVKLVNKSFLRSTENQLRVNIDDVEFVK